MIFFNLFCIIVNSRGSLCPRFPQSLLASFPPLYSRPKVGYLGSWKRKTSSQGRRRSNWRRTSRFPQVQPAGSSVKGARRWVGAWTELCSRLGEKNSCIYLLIYSVSLYLVGLFAPLLPGKRAAEPYKCWGHRTTGPNSRRERRGLCENQRAFLCQPGRQNQLEFKVFILVL